jgi:hypothetical protein
VLQARFNLITADPDRKWLAETAGFCGSETIWDSPKTLAASRSVAARVRAETVKSTGCAIRALEEYDLVFSTARIGGV